MFQIKKIPFYFHSLKNEIIKEFQWTPVVTPFENLIRIGTEYGGWTIPESLFSEKSVCYSAGAGEDISFDVSVVEKFKCPVYIFDPTPKARQHFDLLINSVIFNKLMPINNSDVNYQIKKENISLLKFFDLGLWDREDQIKFYEPKDPGSVSHSILNLQETEKFFIADVDRLLNIMRSEGHDRLDLLKLDIEGAEYNVLNSIIKDHLKINVICVEYHKAMNETLRHYRKKQKESIRALIKFGYKVVYHDSLDNFTFILNNTFSNANKS